MARGRASAGRPVWRRVSACARRVSGDVGIFFAFFVRVGLVFMLALRVCSRIFAQLLALFVYALAAVVGVLLPVLLVAVLLVLGAKTHHRRSRRC